MDEVQRLQKAYNRYNRDYFRKIWSGEGDRYIGLRRIEMLAQLLQRYVPKPLSDIRVLEVGCAGGSVLNALESMGCNPSCLYGIDVRTARIRQAKQRYPRYPINAGDARYIPFSTGVFDVILQLVTFSSILDDDTIAQVSQEMLRVLKSDGVIISYDVRYSNFWNPHTRRISKRSLRRWFPHCHVVFYSLTLIPPLARFVAPSSYELCDLLCKIPLLRSHYFAVIRKR